MDDSPMVWCGAAAGFFALADAMGNGIHGWIARVCLAILGVNALLNAIIVLVRQ